MTSAISRPVLAIALALGMLAAISAPSHAALSTADRSAPAPAATASAEALVVVAAPATASGAVPAPAAAAVAPVATATAPAQPRKVVAATPQPRVSQSSRNAFASAVVPSAGFGRRGGYPCH